MTLSEYIIKHEGKKNKVYDDGDGKPIVTGKTVIGIPTIGVGRNLMTRGLFPDEIALMLKNDIEYFTYEVRKIVPTFDSLSEVRQWVLVDMCLNLGVSGLIEFRQMLKAIAEGKFDVASDAILDSVYAHQVGNRAVENATLMLQG